MQLTDNTVLITGGGSGIGRGLAQAFHRLGNQVIVAGRRKAALDATVASCPGAAAMTVDLESADDIRRFAGELLASFPRLNAVIHNAGVMRNENLKRGRTADAEATIAANLLAPIRLTAALLPHLLELPRATIVTVTSGLAFVPLAMTPTYCATKAAIHSYTQSLRYQLKDTRVEVIEMAPPYVRTGLMGERQGSDPNAMPLEAFIAETMAILATAPDRSEVFVERVKPQRTAEASGDYDAFFKRFNDTMFEARGEEFRAL